MPIAVREVDILDFPEVIAGLERYEAVLVLVRVNQRPLLRLNFPVIDGKITRPALEAALLSNRDVLLALQVHKLSRFLNDQETLARREPKVTATIAVCTRNRPEDLRHCLSAIRQLPDDGQEVLVVDNCPSDESSRYVVESFARVRYVREDKPGLDNARNRAFKEAQGDIVAFIDDDAVPDQQWLRALLGNFDRPIVACVTGLTMPLELETPAQIKFEEYSPFCKGFLRREYSSLSWNPLSTGIVGAGANMAIRRNILPDTGWFDEALDAGTLTKSGGDHEMFTRLLTRGYRIIYEPQAVNWHRHRRTYQELKDTIYGYGVGAYAAMTRTLVVEREIGVLWVAYSWFRHEQLPKLVRSLLRRRNSQPLDLILAELRGCVVGPWAYWRSRWRIRQDRP